jgi:hypothetical protein
VGRGGYVERVGHRPSLRALSTAKNERRFQRRRPEPRWTPAGRGPTEWRHAVRRLHLNNARRRAPASARRRVCARTVYSNYDVAPDGKHSSCFARRSRERRRLPSRCSQLVDSEHRT